MAAKISLCMIVKNEEKLLKNCLNSAKDFADEIIVVDTGSSDRTKAIAYEFTDKVFDFKWTDDFSAARNFSLQKASGDWILVLDADEVVAERDWARLRKIAELDEADAFFLNWRNYTNEIGISGTISTRNDDYEESKIALGYVVVKVLRFFKRGYSFGGIIHETVDASIKQAGKKIFDTDVVIHHYGSLNSQKLEDKKDYYIKLLKKRLEIRDFSDKSEDYILFEIATELSSLKRIPEAVDYLERAVTLKPEYIYLSSLGVLYLSINRMDDGERLLMQAIKKSSEYPKYNYRNPQKYNSLNPVIYNNLGVIYYKKGQINKAIKKFSKSIELNPQFADAYFNMGFMYKLKGAFSLMHGCFDKAIELNSNYRHKIEKILES